MRDRRAGIRHGGKLKAAALLAMLLLAVAPAYAQGKSGSLGVLKSWIEKQIFGKDTPAAEAPAAGEPTGALPGTDSAAGPPSAPDVAAPAAGASPDDGASQAPPLGATGDSVLRGSADIGGAPGPSEPLPELPAVETAAPTTLDGEAPAATVETEDSMPAIPPAEAAKPEPLRFAALAGQSVEKTMALVGPIADDLGKLLDRPVEFLAFPSYGAMIDAQVERRVDGGFYSSAAFALADARCGCLEPLVAPRAFDGTLAYHAIIVVRANSGIRSLADLAGKTVAVGAADSVGARRMQLAGLMAEGVDPAATFGSFVEAGSAEAAVRLVAAHGADAAFAWSSLAGHLEDGYSRGTLTNLVADGAVAMGDLAIVWRSPAIEHGPFALMRTLDEASKIKIQTYLVALVTANPNAYDGLNPFYGGGYAPVDPQDYSGIEILAAQDVDALKIPETAPPLPAPVSLPADEAPPAQ